MKLASFEAVAEALKEAANRPRDLDDIEHLEMLLNEEDQSDRNP